MSDWKTTSSELMYETAWFKIHRDEVLNQNGDPLVYSYIELQNPSVFIIATNAAGEIFIQRVYRYTWRKHFWEIPAGHMDAGEEPLVAAKRELLEEAGLASNDWKYLGRVEQILGTGKAPVEAFLAANARQESSPTDEEEDIQQRQFKDLRAIEQMIADGELVDSAVIAVIYLAKINGFLKENI